MNKHDFDGEFAFVANALVEQMRTAQRWVDVKNAADALVHARLMWKLIQDEAKKHDTAGSVTGAATGMGLGILQPRNGGSI